MNKIRLLVCLLCFFVAFSNSIGAMSDEENSEDSISNKVDNGEGIQNNSGNIDQFADTEKFQSRQSLWPFRRFKKKNASSQNDSKNNKDDILPTKSNAEDLGKVENVTEKEKNKQRLISSDEKSKKQTKSDENIDNVKQAKNGNTEKASDTDKNMNEKTRSTWRSWLLRRFRGKSDKDASKTTEKIEKESASKEDVSKKEDSTKLTANKKDSSKEKDVNDKSNSEIEKQRRSVAVENALWKIKKQKDIKFEIDLSNFFKNYKKISITTDDLDKHSGDPETDSIDTNERPAEKRHEPNISSDNPETDTDEQPVDKGLKSGISPNKVQKNSANKRSQISPKIKYEKKNKNKRKKPKDIKFAIDLSQFLEDEEGELDTSIVSTMMMPAISSPILQTPIPNQLTNIAALPSLPIQPIEQSVNQNSVVLPVQLPNLDVSQSVSELNNLPQSNLPQNTQETGGINNENNNQLNVQQMPSPMYAFVVPTPMPYIPPEFAFNNQNQQIFPPNAAMNNSQPSFLQTFLQNLSGQNNHEQNPRFDSMFPNEYRPNIDYPNQNQRIFDSEQYMMNNANAMNGFVIQGNTSDNGRRNISDDEVAEETIRYLKELGVLDESKFVQLSMKDIGTCIRCRGRKIVTMLDKDKSIGICKSCAKLLINDAENGRSIGDRGILGRDNRNYRRDYAIDLSDEMLRDGWSKYERTRRRDSESGLENELFGGHNGGVIGSLASAALSTALAKDSSQQQSFNGNPSFGMPYDAFSSPMGLPANDFNLGGTAVSENTKLMVLNEAGQLVPLKSLAGTAAPYGYKRSPAPALSLEEGIVAAQQVYVGADGKGLVGANTEQMVLNAAGQLVPASSLAGTAAPYGYKKDPITGAMIPSTSLQDGIAAGQQMSGMNGGLMPTSMLGTSGIGGTGEQMVLNAAGQLVPLSSLAGTAAPYGYKKDPITGAMIPSTSLQDGIAAGQQMSGVNSGSVSQTFMSGTSGIGGTGEQMVLNAAGQLVPVSSLAGTAAPYGYKKDPITGAMIPATSLQDGIVAGQQILNATASGNIATRIDPYQQQVLNSGSNFGAGNNALMLSRGMQQQGSNLSTLSGQNGKLSTMGKVALGVAGVAGVAGLVAGGTALLKKALNKSGNSNEQMVLDANGNLVPLSSMVNTEAPYGYKIDPATGSLIPASFLEEGAATAEQVAFAQETSGETQSSDGTQSASGKSSKWKTIGKVAAGVAAGATALAGTVAALKAIKKSRGQNGTGTNVATIETNESASSSSNAQTEASFGQYPASEVKKARKTSDELAKKIKKANKKIESIKKDVQKAEEKIQKQQQKLATSKNPEKDQRNLDSAQENLERLQNTLKEQQETLDTLQQQQNTLKEKYGKEPGGPI